MIVTNVTAEMVRSLAARSDLLKNLMGVAELQTSLPRRVADLTSRHLLEQAANSLRLHLVLPIEVTAFVAQLWIQPIPATTVAGVLGAAGVAQSTFRDAWRGIGFRADPHEFVDWALLGRAWPERQEGRSWAQIAYRYGISKRRLERISQRRVGVSLEALDTKGAAWAEMSFHVWMTQTLPSP